MGRRKDLSGKRFGRLRAVACTHYGPGHTAYWLCQCDCGVLHTTRGSSLTAGVIKSCGCFNREQSAKRSTVHGGNDTPAHRSWRHMRDRCNNPNNQNYKYYGGRGITICPEWADFSVFRSDMGDPPHGYTLDRINPDGNYEPTNCRWASREVQGRNQRARANSSGYTGVYKTNSGKWVSQIRIGSGKRVCGPARARIEDAIADRKNMEAEHWG